ncbi:ead/Ea22-like family protein [Enterobacter cloacae]|nr:ead/Ea22-like family protein [Enterobacter cloacae]
MSNIDKQALREAALEAEEALQIMKSDIEVDSGHVDSINAFYSLLSPKSVLALLDELEAAEKTSAARLGAIATTHKMFQRERDRAEKAEKRIADYHDLISGLVGVSSSILREVERINNAAAAGKGE